MRLSGTKTSSVNQYNGLGDQLYDLGGAKPTLDLNFSSNESLVDSVTGKTLVQHTRAGSGASSATYVDGDGVIRKAVTNLLLQSEDFSTTWATVGARVTITTNQIASPNGQTTADLAVPNTTTNDHILFQSVSSITANSTYTYTIYAKASGYSHIQLLYGSGFNNLNAWANFNLSGSGSIGFEGTDITATIESLPNGWYRCRATATSGSSVSNPGVVLIPLDSDRNSRNPTFTGDGTSGIYLWGAQLEQSSTVGEYVKTTAAINSAPRFDHDPTTGESLGLLVEEERTNLLQYSEEFDNPSWSTSSLTLTPNDAIAPDGNQTADKLQNTSTTAIITQAITKAAVATTYTASVWVKSNDVDNFTFTIDDGGPVDRGRCTFNITTGELVTENDDGDFTNTSGSITAYPDSWYRITVTTTTNTTTLARFRAFFSGSGDIVYLWGAQLEVGSFPTSYIPTEGSTVTRAADVASIEGRNFGSVNLVEYSEEFDQNTQTRLSVTPNAIIAPNGQLTADKLVLTETGHAHVEVSSVTASTSNAYGYIDLTTGASFRQSGSWNGSTVTDVGNDWWYITVTSDTNYTLSFYAKKGEVNYATWQLFTNLARIGVSDTTNILNTSASGGIYLWGAQLEEGSTATDYIKSDVNWTSRASNATYYDVNGTLKKSSYNLFLQSEDFSTTWTKPSSVAVTVNQATAPDGSLTADLIEGTGADNFINQSVSLVSGTTYTISAYIKSAGLSKDTFRLGGDSIQFSDNFTATSSWQRFEFTFTATATGARNNFITRDSSNNPLGIYIWGAQLETGTYAGDYAKTEGSAASTARTAAYLPDGNGNFVSAGDLLLEGSGTNLLTYSEEADNPAWNIISSSVTVDPDVVTVPDGTQTADKIKEAATTGSHSIEFTGFAFQAGVTYACSCFVKAAERSRIRMTFPVVFANRLVYFDFDPNSYQVISDGGTIASIAPAGNGWFRVSAVSTATTTVAGARIGITLVDTGTNVSYTGDGTSGIYLWGAQLEANSYATSYIPTYGSSATRAADVSSSSSNTFGNSFYNQTEGSIYVQSTNFGNPSDTTLFCLDDGTTGQQNQIDTRLSAGIDYRVRVRSNAVSVSDIDPGPSFALGDSVKLAQVYKVNDYAASQNGLTAVTDTSGAMPLTSQTNLKLNKRGSGNTVGHTCFERITYWPTRLSNDTLQTITA